MQPPHSPQSVLEIPLISWEVSSTSPFALFTLEPSLKMAPPSVEDGSERHANPPELPS